MLTKVVINILVDPPMYPPWLELSLRAKPGEMRLALIDHKSQSAKRCPNHLCCEFKWPDGRNKPKNKKNLSNRI